MRKSLTRTEEFEILKLVLDKFLWLGILIMGYGLWQMMQTPANLWPGIAVVLSGGVLILIFMGMLIQEYDYMK